MILRKHTNALLNLIREENLEPRDFESQHGIDDEFDSFTVSVRETPLFFKMRAILGSSGWVFDCKYSTYRREYPKATFPEGHHKTWAGRFPDSSFEQLEKWFRQWLQEVTRLFADRREIADDFLLPDLWSEVAAISKAAALARAGLENTAFTPDEQSRIEVSLHDFARQVQEHNLLAEDQIDLLNRQVANLVEASRRLGRKDWLVFLLGSLVTLAASAGFSPEVANMVIKLGGESVYWIASTPLLLR
jgi:hypothetical protein